MKPKVLTLAEHNAKRGRPEFAAPLVKPKFPRPNGLKCDICEKELSDVDGKLINEPGKPAQLKVICKSCGFEGFRFA